MKKQYIIGGLEDISFPDWGIKKIRARVDTGARTSAIHIDSLKLLPYNHLEFYVIIGWKGSRRRKRIVTNIKSVTWIKPTTGKRVKRFVVSTTMQIGTIKRRIDITLADREKMQFRMLLGRSALRGDFLVSPSRRCMLSSKRGAVCV